VHDTNDIARISLFSGGMTLRFLMCALAGVVAVSSNAAAQDARSPQRPALNAMEALGTDSTAWQRVITFEVSWHSAQLVRAATNAALQPWRIELPAAEPQRALLDEQLRRVLRAREPVDGDSSVYALSLGALRIAGDSAFVKFSSSLTQQCAGSTRLTGYHNEMEIVLPRAPQSVWGVGRIGTVTHGDRMGC